MTENFCSSVYIFEAMNTRTKKRWKAHIATAVLSVSAIALLFFGLPPIYALSSSDPNDLNRADDVIFRLSLSLGYVALLLLLFTLLISIWSLLTNKKLLPIQYDVRRDVGIWAGILGILHSLVGLFVHFRDKPNSFLYYFIFPPETKAAFPLRYDLFGLANYTGLFGVLLVALLLAISNDFALRKLGAKKWKNLQRLNYVFFAFVFVHSVIYAAIEKRPLPMFAFTLLLFGLTVALQIFGIKKHRSLQDKKTEYD